MITASTFFGYIFLGYLLAYLIGYSINGLISLLKKTR